MVTRIIDVASAEEIDVALALMGTMTREES
jgi:hypothetical protein